MIILLIVQKYGGSSVATTDLILNIAKRVKKQVELVEKIPNLPENSLKFMDEFLDLILKWSKGKE